MAHLFPSWRLKRRKSKSLSIFCTRWARLLVARDQANEASDSGDLQPRKANERWIFQEMANGYLVFLKLGKATHKVHNPGDQLCRAARPRSWEKATFRPHTDDHPLPWAVVYLIFWVVFGISVALTMFQGHARALLTIKFNCTNER